MQLVLGLIFVLSGCSKLVARERFARTIRRVFSLASVRVSRGVSVTAGLTLSSIEVLAGIALVLDIRPHYASAVVVGLLLLFSVVAVVAIVERAYIPCTCFGGASERELGTATLARTIPLLAAACLVLSRAGGSWPKSFTQGMDEVLLAVAILLLGRWILGAPQIIESVRARRAFDPEDLDRSRFRATKPTGGIQS